MHYVGPCDVCGQGLRGVRACSHGHLAVVCDECEALWTAPSDSQPRFSSGQELSCPTCGEPLWGTGSHWADTRELRTAGWDAAVLGEYNRSSSPSLRSPPDEACDGFTEDPEPS
jgi:hypothetical protein